jgi:HK97 family phage major capsid protein
MAMMKRTDPLFDPEVVTVIESDRGGPMGYPSYDDTSATAVQVTDQNTQSQIVEPALGQLAFPTCPTWRSGIVRCSVELDQDTAFRFDTLLERVFAIRFARGLGAANVATLLAAAMVGVGPTTSPAIVGDDNSGGSPDATSQVGVGDLLNLIASLDDAYLSSPRCFWLMNLRTLIRLWGLRDKSGRTMLPQLYDDRGFPMLLGKPVAISPTMPSIGSSHTPIALGALDYFVVRTVKNSLRVHRHGEQWIEYGQVGFQAFMRGQGGFQITNGADSPVKVIKNA